MTSTIDQVLLQPLGTIVNPDGTTVIAFKTQPEATLAQILVARAEREEEEERREQQRRREQLQDLLAVTQNNLNMLQIRHRVTYRRYTELPLRSRGARRIHLETLNALTYNIGETTDQIRLLEEQLAAMEPMEPSLEV
jgi:hypothetical protein